MTSTRREGPARVEDEAPGGDSLERYRTVEYHGESSLVVTVQDTENAEAWVQSDLTVEVTT